MDIYLLGLHLTPSTYSLLQAVLKALDDLGIARGHAAAELYNTQDIYIYIYTHIYIYIYTHNLYTHIHTYVCSTMRSTIILLSEHGQHGVTPGIVLCR